MRCAPGSFSSGNAFAIGTRSWPGSTTRAGRVVELTVRHDGLPTQSDYDAISGGWPAVMANLTSLLETGEVLPQAPWDMALTSR